MFNSFISKVLIKYIIAIVVVLLRGVLLTLSAYFYNRQKGKKEKIGVYISIFIFGLLAVIFYAIKERKVQNPVSVSENGNHRCKIISIILFALYLVSLVGGSAFIKIWSPVMTEVANEREAICYDMYGNSYDSFDKVLFYTKDGCRFVRDNESGNFIRLDESQLYNQEYTLFVSYVDTEGYLVFLDEILLVDDEKANAYELLCLYDEDGNYYAMAGNVKWDSAGNMLHKGE